MTKDYACPHCEGKGTYKCEYDDGEEYTETCRECGGTGKLWTTIPLEEYDRLRAIEAAERWIPVTERLPEETGLYRCWTKTPLQKFEIVEMYRGSGRWNLTNIRTPATVTHWRPLASGPKEDDRERT